MEKPTLNPPTSWPAFPEGPSQLTNGILSKKESPEPLGPVWSLSVNTPEAPSRQSLALALAPVKSVWKFPFPAVQKGPDGNPACWLCALSRSRSAHRTCLAHGPSPPAVDGPVLRLQCKLHRGRLVLPVFLMAGSLASGIVPGTWGLLNKCLLYPVLYKD